VESRGFKELTVENWLKPDVISANFFSIDDSGQSRIMSGEDWIRRILRPQLNDSVPLEARKLYEVARGTMAYGFLFYPIYTLATEQLFRVAETAIKLLCESKGTPKRIKSFDDKLKWLAQQGIISARVEHSWQKIRRLRNESSHPNNQNILPPGWAIGFLDYIAEQINALF
jgi:hypothetical protein